VEESSRAKAWTYDPAHDLDLPAGQRLKSPRREPGLGEWLIQLAWWGLVRGYLRIVHRLKITGGEHLPTHGPAMLVANHCSHLDAMVLVASLPLKARGHAFPLAAGDTFFVRPLTTVFAAAALNAIPLWRKKTVTHAVREMRSKLTAEGCVLVLFPEGTRSRTGQMADFKPGVGMLVAETDVPVVPCCIIGTFDALPSGRRCPRPVAVELRVGAPMHFAGFPNSRPGWEQVARELQSRVKALDG
jgi:1-acyl-sn-glycerol-3-phosphate acyltransferase